MHLCNLPTTPKENDRATPAKLSDAKVYEALAALDS